MNGDQNKGKDSALKTLAIIGFTAMIVGGVWLAVQVVQLAPTAFTSLASLAENVYGTPNATELTTLTNKSVVNSNETFSLMWSELDDAGVYQFTYVCTEGVSLLTRTSEGTMESVTCDQPFTLTGNGETQVKIISDTKRFIDVSYSLAFVPEGETESTASDINRVTVVNATIPQPGLVAGTQDEEEPTDNTEDEGNEDQPTPTPEEETEDEPDTDITTPPVTVPEYTFTYELPVSNPAGYVDLRMSYLGVGEIFEEQFVPHAEIDNDDEGAIRFSVKNIGTKTSREWTYKVLLPSGVTYSSPSQLPLKPQEEAMIVLGFDTSKTGIKPIEGEVKTDEDRNKSNNDFSWSVNVTN